MEHLIPYSEFAVISITPAGYEADMLIYSRGNIDLPQLTG